MISKKYVSLLMVSALSIGFSGCATILSGKHQKINVTSTPSNEEVMVGAQTVTTPAIVEVRRSDENLIVKSKNCNDQKMLASKINPVFFVNILSGGAFGSTTDYATDSMWKYDENVNLNCKK